MPGFHTAVLTVLAMLAFAANSLLCRLALQSHSMDAGSFTAVRLVSGALVLALVVRLRAPSAAAVGSGRWGSAVWLFVYAAAFSLAYLQLSAGVGALLLFGAMQVTMVGVGLWRGSGWRCTNGPGWCWPWADWWCCCGPGCRPHPGVRRG